MIRRYSRSSSEVFSRIGRCAYLPMPLLLFSLVADALVREARFQAAPLPWSLLTLARHASQVARIFRSRLKSSSGFTCQQRTHFLCVSGLTLRFIISALPVISLPL